MLSQARRMGARRIETVVHASNQDGLAFAHRHGFVEFDRYFLDGETAAYVDLYLATCDETSTGVSGVSGVSS